MPIRAAFSLATVLLLSATLVGAASAQDADDPVVATVNGEAIYRSEVVEAIENLPAQYQQVPVDVLIPAIAEQVAIGRLIEREAEAAGLGDDPDVLMRLALARTNILQQAWIDSQVAERMTDEAVAAAYGEFLEANPPEEEINARHILVETEDEAAALVEDLDGGADFGALAREHSIGPSGAAGGELGWFRRGQMVEPFGEVAFALTPGAYTSEPVETQFGWHVIILDDRRLVEPPPLGEMREQLETQLTQGFIQAIIEDVRAAADIQLVDEEEPSAPQDELETETTPADQPTEPPGSP